MQKNSPSLNIKSKDMIDLFDTVLYKKIPEQFTSLFDTGILTKQLSKEFTHESFEFSIKSFALRQIYIQNYGFLLVSKQLINNLYKQLENSKTLEVGAGSGFLASHLQKKVFYDAIDEFPIEQNNYGFTSNYGYVQTVQAEKYLSKHINDYQNILMSWPNYDTSFAHNVLKLMQPKQKLYYCGEDKYGCTANDNFFDLLISKAVLNENVTDELNQNYSYWPGVHDCWSVYNIK